MKYWKEADLFEYLKNGEYPDLIDSNYRFSKWDCFSKSRNHRIELKCRRTHYDTLIIEYPKYSSLMKWSSYTMELPIYICSTPEGVFRYNLKQVNPKWEKQMLRKTTEFYNNNWVEKKVGFLPISKADKI